MWEENRNIGWSSSKTNSRGTKQIAGTLCWVLALPKKILMWAEFQKRKGRARIRELESEKERTTAREVKRSGEKNV